MQEEEIRVDNIIGSRRFSNYFWGGFLTFSGAAFILLGLSSYFDMPLLTFIDSSTLTFVPQGLTMLFYGTLSLFISFYLWVSIIYDIGSGYNEYNKVEGLVKIIRRGFPGNKKEIFLTYSFNNLKSIGIKISEGLNPSRTIYLCLKDERKIPLTPVKQPDSIKNLEQQASSLAKFLNLQLENL